MPGSTLVREVLWRASTLLQDTDPQFFRFPEGDMVRALDDAQMAIGKFVPSTASRIDAIRLKAGTRQSIETIAAADCKPGDGSTPSQPIRGTLLLDVVRNMGADGQTPGRAIRGTPREILDAQSPLWHTTPGAVVSSFMFDPLVPRQFYVTPALSVATWVEIAYTAIPAKTDNSGSVGNERYRIAGSAADVIQINDEHIDDLTNYVVARMTMRQSQWADAAKASAFASMFLSSLNAKAQVVTGTNPNLKVLPFAAEPLARAA